MRNGTPAILIDWARDVRGEDNILRDAAGQPLGEAAIRAVEAIDVTIR